MEQDRDSRTSAATRLERPASESGSRSTAGVLGELTLPAGAVVDRYRIEDLMGRGGMGHVYKATHIHLGRPVALKVIRAGRELHGDNLLRFQREARALAALGSPHIVSVFDYGLHEGAPFLAMELLRGETVQDRLAGHRRLSPHEAVDIALQALDGLAAAHDAGIIHRDIKPANLFLARESPEQRPTVKVLDFGISKVAGDTSSTRAGAVLGTPMFMAPEQLGASSNVDHRSDLYSLGAVLYLMLSGRTPHPERPLNELCLIKLVDTPPPLDAVAPDVPHALARVVGQALSISPHARPPDARAMARALREALSESPAPGAEAHASGSLSPAPPPAAGSPPPAAEPASASGGTASTAALSGAAGQTPTPATLEAAMLTGSVEERPRSRLPLLLGIGTMAAVAGAAGLFLVLKLMHTGPADAAPPSTVQSRPPDDGHEGGPAWVVQPVRPVPAEAERPDTGPPDAGRPRIRRPRPPRKAPPPPEPEGPSAEEVAQARCVSGCFGEYHRCAREAGNDGHEQHECHLRRTNCMAVCRGDRPPFPGH